MMSHDNDTDKNMENQEAPKTETDTAQANTSDADTVNAKTEAASAPDEQLSEQPASNENEGENKEQPDEIDPQQQIADLNEKMLRLAAELENTRRRAERDKSDALRYGVTGFARDMVSVGDNLTRALNAIEETDREGLSDNMINLLEGVGATQRDLMAALQRNGLKPITPEGEKFDPNFHEAIYEAPGTGRDSGTIIEVLEIGYMIGERLLRPAKVGVAKDG
jgi:molecular chaperone GrpE